MAFFRIEWHTAALKELRRLDSIAAKRIATAVNGLALDPFPVQSKKLKLEEERYRIRVGDYRIVYEVENDRLIVLIVHVGHRREIYRNL